LIGENPKLNVFSICFTDSGQSIAVAEKNIINLYNVKSNRLINTYEDGIPGKFYQLIFQKTVYHDKRGAG